MRRLNLSTKMLIAALPLVLALAALLAITVRSDLADIDRAESGAELGAIWDPLSAALAAVENESDPANAGDNSIRRETDNAVNELRDAIAPLGAAEAAGDHVTSSRSALSAARRNLDMATVAPDLQVEIDPAEAYAEASRQLVAVGQLLPSEAGDPELGRELLAVVKLAEAKLAADSIVDGVQRWQDDPSNVGALDAARDDFAELTAVLSEFEAIAPDEWATEFRQAGFTTALAGFRADLTRTVRAIEAGDEATYDTTEFEGLIEGGTQFQARVSDSIVERAEAEVADTRSATWRRIAIALGAAAIAGVLAWLILRSITKRIRRVAEAAQRVSDEQLPALVETLQDPRGTASLPATEPIAARGDDEIAELAGAFNSMQDTLTDVANQQVEVLRRGVSDLFVTMARRNRSLIDRQLALLDSFEAEVDDPEILSNYYQLDHMATRMRRNSESLLVLANAEPKRRRVKATPVDDVVRAAIGEVEDYRRIEIEALESLHVRGNVVADVSHLLAELLDNATSFSPPESVVRVGGRMSDDGYMIRIVDSGMGIGTERLKELNDLLETPPVVGLSVESTLGMSVVSLLANKWNIGVTLSPGNPGLIADVILPADLFGAPEPTPDEVASSITVPDSPAGLGIDADAIEQSLDLANLGKGPAAQAHAAHARSETADEADGQGTEPDVRPDVQSAPVPPAPAARVDDDRPVAEADARSMAANLAAFQSGMKSASAPTDPPTAEPAPVEAADAPGAAAPAAEPTEPDTAPVTPAGAPLLSSDDDFARLAAQVAEPPAAEQAPPAEMPAPTGSATPADGIPTPPVSALEASLAQVTSTPPAPAEFEVPPAPPINLEDHAQQPVVTDNARPAPTMPADGAPLIASLPTRLPGDGPDGGPDRLASAPVPGAGGPHLPTRERELESIAIDDRPAGAPADPDALRDRLRSFQAEFRSALNDQPTNDQPTNDHDHQDLGGDPR